MKSNLLLAAILILTVSCAKSELVLQYEERILWFETLLVEQQSFGDRISDNFLDGELHSQSVKEYLEWLETNRKELENFKEFIEQNYKELQDAGKNPVLIRDLIKFMLENNSTEETFFERCNAIWDRYNE
jgi:hypothetical protein